jgi:hypothetical protein
MKNKNIVFILAGLLIFVALACTLSEMSWSGISAKPDSLRQLVSLPSLAIGNLNPSARSPGLELFCTSLYDTPGGYCNYFNLGVPPINYKITANITETGSK